MYAIFEVHGPFSSEFINFLSTSFVSQINYGHLLEVLDYMPKRSQTSLIYGSFDACFFDGEQFGYLGVCMEIRVAHIVIDSIMSKTVFHTF